MRIQFIGRMPEDHISGGRMLAWTLAESLAMVGHDVSFVTNCRPLIYQDFQPFSKVNLVIRRRVIAGPQWLRGRLRRIKQLARSLEQVWDRVSSVGYNEVRAKADWIIIVPVMGAVDMHARMLQYARRTSKRIALLNFETPNWFNQLSPVKRSPELWNGWNLIAREADLVLSISAEGNHYAKEYYRDVCSKCRFEYVHTAINDWQADRAQDHATRERQTVCMSRVDAHKGVDRIVQLLSPALAGFKLVLCLGGSSSLPPHDREVLTNSARHFGVEVEIREQILAPEKFRLIKESQFMVFPSLFEGYGIPPLEALYCRTPCVVFDLPVLREYGGEALDYAKWGDFEAMRRVVTSVAGGRTALSPNEHWTRIADIAQMRKCGLRVDNILSN